jgi:phospholipid transport system substrate-binding protein
MLAWAIAFVCAGASAQAAASSPMSMLKRSNDEIREILKQEQGSEPTVAQRDRVKKIVNGFLDYEELAKRSLATEWDKLTPAQRTEFVQTFRDLIEKNYVKQLRSNVDYAIDYQNEEVKDSDATVHSVVRAERKGRHAETTIDYKLLAKQGKWAVYDVITDDVSLLRNYRSQFTRIIERDGFQGLLAKMKKRLAETTD